MINSETKRYQRYDLHLKNGEIVTAYEDYDLPISKGIIGQFKRGQKRFLEIDDLALVYTIPYEQISYIVAAGVKKF